MNRTDKPLRLRIPAAAYDELTAAAMARGLSAPQLAAHWLTLAIGEQTGARLEPAPIADRDAILACIRELRSEGVTNRGDIARELTARGLAPPQAGRWTSHLVASWEKHHLSDESA